LTTIAFEFPFTITSPNIGLRAHWSVNHKRAKGMRDAMRVCLAAFVAHKPDLSRLVTVSIQRVSPRKFDQGDNDPFSKKSFRDEIAAWLGVPDNDKRVVWQYPEPERRGARENVVVVRIEDDRLAQSPLPRVFTEAEVNGGQVKLCKGSGKPASVAAPTSPCSYCGKPSVPTRAKGEVIVLASHPEGSGVARPAPAPAVEDASPPLAAPSVPVTRPCYLAHPDDQREGVDDDWIVRKERWVIPNGCPESIPILAKKGMVFLVRRDAFDRSKGGHIFVYDAATPEEDAVERARWEQRPEEQTKPAPTVVRRTPAGVVPVGRRP
jgi:hypothetical protein